MSNNQSKSLHIAYTLRAHMKNFCTVRC